MSATKKCDTRMTDIQMLKRILEEKFGWTKFEIKTDDKQPLPKATMWSGQPDIENPDLVVRQRYTGGNYADFAVKRNPDGTLSLYGDPHGLQNISGYEKYRGNNKEEWDAGFNKFKDDAEIEYSKKEFEKDATLHGAELSNWEIQGTEVQLPFEIDLDNIDNIQDIATV
jgi:hypothetical protein